MKEAPEAGQPFTSATVPLRREYFRQPVLLDPFFPERSYLLPKIVPGQEARVCDADYQWEAYNGREGTVTHYSYFTGLHTIAFGGRRGTYAGYFLAREIMKARR